MSGFDNIVLGPTVVPSLIVTIVLLLLIGILPTVYWMKRHKGQVKISYFIAGALGFIVSARVLEAGFHYFFLLADNPISQFLNGNTVAFILYGMIMAGVFEECGRYIVLKYIMKKHRTRENAVLYGIGHGVIEILTVVLPVILLYLVIATSLQNGSVDSVLKALHVTEKNAAVAMQSFQAAAQFNAETAMITVLERISSIGIHIGCSIIVYYSVIVENKKYLGGAVLLHMMADFFAALYQRNVLGAGIAETGILFMAIVIVWIATKIYKKLA